MKTGKVSCYMCGYVGDKDSLKTLETTHEDFYGIPHNGKKHRLVVKVCPKCEYNDYDVEEIVDEEW